MNLLIVGTLRGYMSEASKIAMTHGAKVFFAESHEKALDVLRSGFNIELAFVDITLNVDALIKMMRNEKILVPVVACGVGADCNAAECAISAGALEYVTLPPNAELIAELFQSVNDTKNDLIIFDPKMKELFRVADRVAKSDANILITGESGTGKEVVTKYIHEKSFRKNKNFVAVNCAAIPETLLESELFGHEKGAFTGALARRIGKFEEADKGTLFLDEISEMNLQLQAKLLRAIQEREITRVGGNSVVKVDIRIIATSNRNLMEYVKKGNFREDLYYRLNVINLHVPSLRDRSNDIAPLAEYFLKKYSVCNGLDHVKTISENGLSYLKTYNWPGNVRELENAMYRAVLLTSDTVIEDCKGIVDAEEHKHNQLKIKTDDQTLEFEPESLADMEKQLIEKTLRHCFGNKTHTANILGISIRTLRNKLQQYEMEKAG